MDKQGLFAELAEPIFALSANGISEPIKTSLGWHLMQVTKIIPADKPTLAEIKDDLLASMKRDQAIESITKSVNKLDDELAAGHALEDIAMSCACVLSKFLRWKPTAKRPMVKP